MADDVRLYHINTSTLNNLNNRQFAFESTNDADLGWKMAGGKNNSGEVTKFLGKDKAARVSTLTATGAVTITSGSITIDSLSLSTVSNYQLLYGDFQQSSTLKFEDDKLRVGSTSTPEYKVDIDSTTQDNLRVRNTNGDANGPLIVLEKTSTSPADDDSCGKIIFRGTNDDLSVPEVDYGSIECVSSDVSSDSTDGSMAFKTKVDGVDTEVISIKDGNVGFGTIDPLKQLHINSANAGQILLSEDLAKKRGGSIQGQGYGVNDGGILRFFTHADDSTFTLVERMSLSYGNTVTIYGSLTLGHTTSSTPAANHTYIYAKSDDTIQMVASDTTEKELITLTSTRNIQWTTFTPTVTLVGGTGNTVPVYSTNSGRYRRYDDIVYVDVLLSGDGGDEGAGSGVINIALPVTSGSSVVAFNTIQIGTIYNNESYYILNGNISASSNTISLSYYGNISYYTNVTGASQDNANRSISMHFFYEVD